GGRGGACGWDRGPLPLPAHPSPLRARPRARGRPGPPRAARRDRRLPRGPRPTGPARAGSRRRRRPAGARSARLRGPRPAAGARPARARRRGRLRGAQHTAGPRRAGARPHPPAAQRPGGGAATGCPARGPTRHDRGPHWRARRRPRAPAPRARPRCGPHHDARDGGPPAGRGTTMRVLGMMSGTSLDAIDVALVEFSRSPHRPATLRARLLHVGEEPWPETTRDGLRAVLPPAPADVAAWSRLHAAVGEAFGAAASRVLAAHGGADLIAAHGQTLYHEVHRGQVLSTLQIGDASRLAAATGVPVLHDLRSSDVAAGGQGAPLAPLLDQLLLGADQEQPTAVLNIGGISNLSLVGGTPGTEVLSGDLGPGNALLDAAVHAATGRAADIDAALARTGTVDAAALATLLDDPFYSLPLPRSTGREHFDSAYVRRALGEEACAALALPDLLATLTELTAVTIA